MPVELVPEPLRAWINDVAELRSVDLEMPAISAIVSAAGLLGRQLAIYPKAHDTGWVETGNLWGGIIALPSSRKTQALADGMAHVRRIETQEIEAHAAESLSREVQKEVIEAQVVKLKRAATQKTGDPEAMQEPLLEKRRELAALDVSMPRLIVNDTTVEKLGELLVENPNGLLYSRDELVAMLEVADLPNRPNDRPFLLEAWNGTGGYTFDRIGRGTKRIPFTNLSIVGGAQPGRFRKYIDAAIKGEKGADGLLQRFQLMIFPDRRRTKPRVDRVPDKVADDRAADVYQRIRNLDVGAFGATRTAKGGLPALHFTPDAQERFNAFLEDLNTTIDLEETAAAPAFQSHLVKFSGLAARLALVFHVIGVCGGQPPGPVTLEALDLAIEWCAFLEHHARKMYAAELNRNLHRAHKIARLIENGDIATGASLRDVYNDRPGLGDAADVRRALSILREHGWLQIRNRSNPGARASEIIDVNPDTETR